jgi:hypothetical protein
VKKATTIYPEVKENKIKETKQQHYHGIININSVIAERITSCNIIGA